MKRIVLTCGALIACIAFGGLALALQNPDVQAKAQAAKEAAARNQQALHAYSWTSTTEISVKGEVKNTKIESCQYGPDGKVQKTELSEPPPPPEKQRGRRGRRRDRIVAKKTGEMKEEMQAAGALVQSYVPPSSEKIQAAIAAGKVSMSPGTDTATIRFADYEKAGDSLTLTLDQESKSLQHVTVDTYLDEPDDKVTLDVSFASLPDGTSYAGETVLAIPKDNIEVRIENSNYLKLAQ